MSEIKDNSKIYYWIKLKTDFFESDAIDFLLSQEDGCKYVTLYLKLCTMTSNTDGVLATKIGNILVPYTVEKIARDTKFFSADIVRVALELFQNLRLIVVSENNVMKIANYESMIGSETGWAQKKRLYRENKQRKNQKWRTVKMKTKKQTEKQELKYAPGDKVVYHCAGVDREGIIAYVDDTDNVAPYRINLMNIRGADIIEKVAKRRGRPAAKKQVEEKMAESMQAIANDCGLKA